MADKIRVGVLFGGQSGEHEVSLVSASAVMDALDRTKYEIVPIGITKQGRWIAGDKALPTLTALADPKLLPASAELKIENAKSKTDAAKPNDAADVTDTMLVTRPDSQFSILNSQLSIDVVFPVLHGPMGEDGTVQGLLELAGVPYVGCGVLASAVGLDKAMMKAAFSAAGLPQVPWLLVPAPNGMPMARDRSSGSRRSYPIRCSSSRPIWVAASASPAPPTGPR
jgi:D-alanine-D-alanine ligase